MSPVKYALLLSNKIHGQIIPARLITEDERLRYFEQSARTRDGNKPDYRDIETDSSMRGVEV